MDSIPRRARWLGVGALALVLVAVGIGFVVGSAGGGGSSRPIESGGASGSPTAIVPGSSASTGSPSSTTDQPGGSTAAAPTPSFVAITVGSASCAPGWVAPPSGNATFAISNVGSQSLDVQLLGPDRATVFAAIELLAAGTSANLTVTLAPGPYLWACVLDDVGPTYSAQETVTGAAVAGAPGFVPVTGMQLEQAVLRYRVTVTTGLKTLAADTDRFAAAVTAGNAGAARTLWLTAHLDYERLGAAYGTFGDFDDEIDGRPWGLPGGVTDPGFTGFLRLEYGLWHGQPLATLSPIARKLDQDVHALQAAFPNQTTPVTDLPIRVHEILENALQFELTGSENYGSQTELATVRANVSGTTTVLTALAPLLAPRNQAVVTAAQNGLADLAAMLDAFKGPDGSWTPLSTLTLSQRQQLDGQVGQLLEELAPIPDMLELAPSTQ